jgi:carboxypeptidase C (cathepsin A)
MGDYLDALNRGSTLPAADRASVLHRMAGYTGLSEEYLGRADLRVALRQFNEELNRSRGLVSGRLDSRFTGPELNLLSENMEYDPQSNAISGAFTTAINAYLREELRFPAGDQRYSLGGGVDWNWAREGARGWRSATYVGSDLAQALVANVNLRVEVENGYYDMATPFYATEYTMDHLGLRPDLRSHITLKYYDAGHMMYLHEADLAQLKSNIAQFIGTTSHAQ